MNKNAGVVFVALILGMSTSAYAQKNQLAVRSLQAMTGGVPSAFTKEAALSVQSARTLGQRITSAQFTLANSKYISSSQLFNQVVQTRSLPNLMPEEERILAAKFEHLDELVQLGTPEFTGYHGALWSATPTTGRPEVLRSPQVQSMVELLDLQQYMRLNKNEFPRLFTVSAGGWLLASDCLSSQEGNSAFRKVVDILIKEQAGEASPVVVEQLALLYAQASNPVPVKAVVEQLKAWQNAHNTTTEAPRLPKDVSEVSLRSSAETLWLTTEIRLLQLTPGIELPEIIKTAKVTQ